MAAPWQHPATRVVDAPPQSETPRAMKPFTERLIASIDRILWASRMASLTSPTFWGRCSHCGETSPWITSARASADACTRCDLEHPRPAEAHRHAEERPVAHNHRLAHA